MGSWEGRKQAEEGWDACMSVGAEESLVCLQSDLHARTDWGAGNPLLLWWGIRCDVGTAGMGC